jgi:ADP-dependent NAD(P)H-hydrate dehydratase / NAD(P)H-hydrate epimerase
MVPVLSRAQMRAFDAHAIQQCGVPGLVLMENAGRGATDVLVAELLGGDARGTRPVVVCGSGNNGGDGLVIARHLLVRGASPIVFFAGDAENVSGDARANFDAWRGIGGEIQWLPPGSSLVPLRDAMAAGEVVVDALFGTGLDRAIEGWRADVVQAINAAPGARFAVDLPSGLDADTGGTLGVSVEAKVTATFAHYKLGLLTPSGASLAGKVRVVDIGVPPSLVAHVGGAAQRLEPGDLASLVGPRPPGAHKTSAGHVVVVAGSAGKVGAPQLSARGAMRAGAGVATIATWPDAATAIESHILEAMTARIDPETIAESLDGILKGKHAVVVGPGFGLGDDARIAVEYILAAWQGPVVIDADALSMFAGRPSVLLAAKNAILTPHPGELARLLGKTIAQVESDRFHAARELVAATGAVVVLKGAHTIIASPDSRVAVSPVACPALATAGSGDVLSGIVGAMACTLSAFDAACAGVMVHALAGEAWSRAHGDGDRGMLASELADAVLSVRRANVR